MQKVVAIAQLCKRGIKGLLQGKRIAFVSDDGDLRLQKMHADLMASAGLWFDADEADIMFLRRCDQLHS